MGVTPSPQRYTLKAQLFTVMAGAAMAFAIFQIWRLEGRWFYVTVIGASLVLLSLVFVRRFADFLMFTMFFVFPVASFTKWFGLDNYVKQVADAAPHSGSLGIGIFEFVLAGLYFVWFLRVFVTRTAPLPKFQLFDGLAIAIFVSYLLSIPGTYDTRLALFSTEYLFVHLLLYFYLSRNLQRHHLAWFILAIFFAVTLEAGIGIGQNRGWIAAGLALDKGAGGEDLDFQYEVPGMEDTTRSTGTLYDSHSLGLYAVMLVGYLAVFLYTPGVQKLWRLAAAAAIVFGLATMLVTYSRSSWLTCVIVMSFAIYVHAFVFHERKILWAVFAFAVLSLPAMPWAIDIVYERFAHAPTQIIATRFELVEVALEIWRNYFIFGYGVGNYMYALDFYNFNMSEELPVHNMFLWIAAESGLVGLLCFVTLIGVTVRRLWRYVRVGNDPLRRFALAALISVLAYVIDGMTNPLYRDLVVYKMFWFAVALAAALPRLTREADDIER